jgi:hypothetical protein
VSDGTATAISAAVRAVVRISFMMSSINQHDSAAGGLGDGEAAKFGLLPVVLLVRTRQNQFAFSHMFLSIGIGRKISEAFFHLNFCPKLIESHSTQAQAEDHWEEVMSIPWTIIIGFVAGVIARFFHPGNKYEPRGLF